MDIVNVNDLLLTNIFSLQYQLNQLNYKFDQHNTLTPVCKRTISEIIFHLVVYENMYFSEMLYRYLYNKDTDVKSYDDSIKNIINLTDIECNMWIQHLINERIRNVNLLNRYTNILQNNYTTHIVHGVLNIKDIINKVIEHDKHHLEEIKKITSYFKE